MRVRISYVLEVADEADLSAILDATIEAGPFVVESLEASMIEADLADEDVSVEPVLLGPVCTKGHAMLGDEDNCRVCGAFKRR